MANNVVKIIADDDGTKIDNPVWHLSITKSGGNMTLCSGEFYGIGESSCTFKTKQGKITCPDCIAEIKFYKSIKL